MPRLFLIGFEGEKNFFKNSPKFTSKHLISKEILIYWHRGKNVSTRGSIQKQIRPSFQRAKGTMPEALFCTTHLCCVKKFFNFSKVYSILH